MCTLNLTVDETVMEQVKPVFPNQAALLEYAQKQLDMLLKKVAEQCLANSAVLKNYECRGDWRSWDISPEILDIVSGTSKASFDESDLDYKKTIGEVLKERYESLS